MTDKYLTDEEMHTLRKANKQFVSLSKDSVIVSVNVDVEVWKTLLLAAERERYLLSQGYRAEWDPELGEWGVVTPEPTSKPIEHNSDLYKIDVKDKY